MLLKDLVNEIHQNAVEHGWWDEKRNLSQVGALIHSELSEALEEARSGRPMVYKLVLLNGRAPQLIVPGNYGWDKCPEKPEGVAVELMDAVIRAMDLEGALESDFEDGKTGQEANVEDLWGLDQCDVPEDISMLVALMHAFISHAIFPEEEQEGGLDHAALMSMCGLACTWVKEQGLDPLEIILMKHQYNKGRPRKHGKLF